MSTNNLLNQSKHNIDNQTTRIKRNLLVRMLLFMTSPKSLSGLLVFGVLGLFFDENLVYQISYGTIIFVYLIPIVLYFSRDIIDIEDFIDIHIPKFNLPKFNKKKKSNQKHEKSNRQKSSGSKSLIKFLFPFNSNKSLAAIGFKFMDVHQKQSPKRVSNNLLTGKKMGKSHNSSNRNKTHSTKISKKKTTGLSSLVRKNF